MKAWSWKVADAAQNPQLNLRYEPGGWGDLLKGVWALAVGEALAARASGRAPSEVHVLDPFAGAPTYPLVPGTVARLDALRAGAAGEDPLVQALLARTDADRAQGVLASAAHLVQGALLAAGATTRLSVFDLDPVRRAAWAGHPGAQVLPITSGEQALGEPADVAFVDPYDFEAAWPALRARLTAQPDALVMIYLFNHAPKSANALRDYRAMRRDLDQALGDERALVVGRVASDALLPRAWHEVLLGGPRELIRALSAPLGAATRAMARHLSDEGAFEARGV